MDNLFTSPPRESSVDTVINRIKTLLLERKLHPGDLLPPEHELAEGMGVSRGTIREAMKILSALGIVEVKRGNGTYVSTTPTTAAFDPLLYQLMLSDADQRQMAEFRQMMEMGIVGLAVEHASDEDLAALQDACRRMAGVADAGADAVAADLDFHRALGHACGNVLAEKVYCFVLELFQPRIAATYSAAHNSAAALGIHEAILDGLRQRDRAAALEATRASIEAWSHRSGGEGAP